ncbi:glycosyltransferase family 39 protein [Patescibacteria group bacterium]|nr:glycosyltransferase family 39 protein [Patescibacteria group bacterium]
MQKQTIKYLSITFFVVLLIWGTYTFLYYLGVPYHGIVFLERPVFDALTNSCANSQNGVIPYICRGLNSFWPFLENSIRRMSPFLWYAIVSTILYGLTVGFLAFKTGRVELKWRVKPWHMLFLFVGSLWLIFTVFSAIKEGDVSIRRLVEPLPNVYTNVGEEGLQTLQDNLDRLLSQNCLTYEGNFNNGAKVYQLKNFCIQKSFVMRVVPLLLFILLLLFEMLVMGRAIIMWIKLKPDRLLLESMLSVGFGACSFIALLWTMAVISLYASFLPLFSAPAGWGMLALIPLVGYKHTRYWFTKFISASWNFERSWRDPYILLSWLLITYLAFNFLSVVRPFPIGWDDLGSYLNRPRLMVSYGHFIFPMAPFFWEYMTSLGFLLFGYESHFGAAASMMINWSAGLLATLSVFTFTSVFLGKGRGVLAALLYYTLPMVGHFSFADMKIDNAVFTMGVLSTLCVFFYLFRPDEEEDKASKRSVRWLIAAGIFGGFAFAMKPTAIMVLVTLGAILVGASLHWSAFIGMIFIAIAIFSWQGLNITRTFERIFGEGVSVSPKVFLYVSAIIGLVSLTAVSIKYKKHLKQTVQAILIFGISFFVAVLPWIAHNNFLYGNIIPRLELKAPNNISPSLHIYETVEAEEDSKVDVKSLPPELLVDRNNPLCTPTGGVEELDRYWGFENGWGHYLTLPWRTTMNMDSTGYYVTTTPILLLIPLLLLLPFFWMRRARWVRWLFVGTLFLVVQWMFMANGIIWYGLGMFLGLVVLLEVLVAKAPDTIGRSIASILIGLSLIGTLAMRMWQYETQKNLLEYPLGKASAEVMVERTVPYYDDVADIVVQRHHDFPNSPYLYRVGTFIPYFIPRNLEIIGVSDHQLDYFNCIHHERDPKLTLERIKALGFNSFIFDTNTATIEKDPNGSLHKKVNAFIDFINNPELGLQIVISDTNAGIAFILIP